MSSLTWEAFRLTSKSPSEVLHVLGPHGVDDLIRKAMDACWREYPEASRSYESVKKRMLEVYNRNMRHWSSIKKPTPAAYFDRLLPYTADGHMRQALVLAWMMLPRAGGRDFKDVKKIVTQIFERNLEAWDQDNRTFTAPPVKKRAKVKAKATSKRNSKTQSTIKRAARKTNAGKKR
jgi:hypothetical protein